MTASVAALRVDGRSAPFGIGNHSPEFAWHVVNAGGQSAYEIEVSTDDTFADAVLWRSGRVEGSEPFGVTYAGDALPSRSQIWWRVRVWVPDGSSTPWAVSSFETGILADDEWKAAWITGGEAKTPRTVYFRHDVPLTGTIRRARAYTSALGWYRLLINGTDVTGAELVPRWTPFDDHVEYQAYDVTEALRPGENVIGLIVSEGRYRGRLGGIGLSARYGDHLAAIAQLQVEMEDGSTVEILSDASWKVAEGPIVSSDPKHGERVDLRIPDPLTIERRETMPSAVLLPPHPRRLIAEQVERVTETARLTGAISRTPSGRHLVDFGQNFSGVARVRLRGPEGTSVSLAYGEVLTPDGELDTTYLGNKESDEWFQTDRVVLAGDDVEYQPSGTIHGFRYLVIDGLRTDLGVEDVVGIVITTAFSETAEFECSDPRLEKLHRNVLWSLRSNFTDTPTDCPTRERSGWTGDVQVFGPTAIILADVDAYLRRYLANVAIEQLPDGRVPVFIPTEAARSRRGIVEKLFLAMSSSAGWGDVTTLLPWTLYWYDGDRTVLRQQFRTAQKWVDQLARRAATRRGPARWFGRRAGRQERFIVDSGFHYGEWLRPGESLNVQMRDAVFAPRAVVATAYLAHSAKVLADTAEILGMQDEATRYAALADDVRGAWSAAFVRDNGARIGDDKQDDYVRALSFDLLEEHQREAALTRLVELIEENDDHLATGFLSTGMLLPVLSRHGRADVAFRVLDQPSAPSWLAQIERGATTIWETWDGYKADGKADRSHNHYAFGAVASWLHEDLAGLRPTAAAYRRFRIQPTLGGGVTSAKSAVTTPYGRASVHWCISGDRLRIDVEVPPGTSAELVLPDGSVSEFFAGAHVVDHALIRPEDALSTAAHDVMTATDQTSPKEQ